MFYSWSIHTGEIGTEAGKRGGGDGRLGLAWSGVGRGASRKVHQECGEYNKKPDSRIDQSIVVTRAFLRAYERHRLERFVAQKNKRGQKYQLKNITQPNRDTKHAYKGWFRKTIFDQPNELPTSLNNDLERERGYTQCANHAWRNRKQRRR